MKTVELKCVQRFYESGQIEIESFYLNGKYHNETGPAYRSWHENGQLEREAFFLNDNRHNENGAAIRHWRANGQLEYEQFYLNGNYLTPEEFTNRNSCSGKIVEIDGKKYQLKEVK